MDFQLLQRAQLLIQHDRFDEASGVIMQALSQDPANPAALRLLGICRYSQDDDKGALDIFRQAIAADPEDAELRVCLARCHIALDQYDEAHRVLDAAQGLDPDLADVHAVRAVAFYEQTRWADAEQAARRAMELDSDDLTAQNMLSHALMMQGRREESEAHIETRMARDPENEYTHIAAGYAALRRGDHEGAAGHFSESLRLNPENNGAREGLLTSFRARSVVYRSFLAFSFKVAQLQAKTQRWLFIGAYVVYRIVVGMLKPVAPALATIVVILYAVFVLWSYVARGIGTLFILGDSRARQALKPGEKWEGILVGGGALVGLSMVLLSLVLPDSDWLFDRGVALAAMSVPWSLAMDSETPAGRGLYGFFAVTGSIGLAMVLTGLKPGTGMLIVGICAMLPTILAAFGLKRK